MPYKQLSRDEVDYILEKRRMKKDKYGMNWYRANDIAKEIFGSKGFAAFHYAFTSNDPVGPDNWVIPMGELIGYDIGYQRKGKKGAKLSTRWGSLKLGYGNSYVECFASLYKDYVEKNVKMLGKVEEVLMRHDLLG
jgi:hypothetical protein